MRRHGTRACYVFGIDPGSDRTKGCRCEPCRDANRTYARSRDRATRRPDVTVEPAYIDATEVREHLRWLSAQGVGLRTVAATSRTSRSALAHLKAGTRTRCTPAVADRVLAVGRHRASEGAYIDAQVTWKLLDDLLAHGHTRTELARLLGSRAKTPALQLGRDRVTAANARKVAELHRALMADLTDRRARNAAQQRRHRTRTAA